MDDIWWEVPKQPLFDGVGWVMFFLRFRATLGSIGLKYLMLEDKSELARSADEEEFEIEDARARQLLMERLSDRIALEIGDCRTTAEMIGRLKKKYGEDSVKPNPGADEVGMAQDKRPKRKANVNLAKSVTRQGKSGKVCLQNSETGLGKNETRSNVLSGGLRNKTMQGTKQKVSPVGQPKWRSCIACGSSGHCTYECSSNFGVSDSSKDGKSLDVIIQPPEYIFGEDITWVFNSDGVFCYSNDSIESVKSSNTQEPLDAGEQAGFFDGDDTAARSWKINTNNCRSDYNIYSKQLCNENELSNPMFEGEEYRRFSNDGFDPCHRKGRKGRVNIQSNTNNKKCKDKKQAGKSSQLRQQETGDNGDYQLQGPVESTHWASESEARRGKFGREISNSPSDEKDNINNITSNSSFNVKLSNVQFVGEIVNNNINNISKAVNNSDNIVKDCDYVHQSDSEEEAEGIVEPDNGGVQLPVNEEKLPMAAMNAEAVKEAGVNAAGSVKEAAVNAGVIKEFTAGAVLNADGDVQDVVQEFAGDAVLDVAGLMNHSSMTYHRKRKPPDKESHESCCVSMVAGVHIGAKVDPEDIGLDCSQQCHTELFFSDGTCSQVMTWNPQKGAEDLKLRYRCHEGMMDLELRQIISQTVAEGLVKGLGQSVAELLVCNVGLDGFGDPGFRGSVEMNQDQCQMQWDPGSID